MISGAIFRTLWCAFEANLGGTIKDKEENARTGLGAAHSQSKSSDLTKTQAMPTDG